MNLRCYPHPGKYEGETMLTPYLHSLSMAGCDDETGDVSEGGWYGLLRGPFKSEGEFADVTPDADLTTDERAYLAQLAGVILYEDENGFVTAELHETGAELDASWKEITDTAAAIAAAREE